MSAAPVRLLLLEDNPADAELLQRALADLAAGEFSVTHVVRLADALVRIGLEHFDAVLCDLGLPDSSGVATARAIAARFPMLPLVVLTGASKDDLGREAIEHGAQDFLVKGQSDGALIARTLRYAMERKRLERGLRAANEALERRVDERTAELETTVSKLQESLSRSRALSETTIDAIIIADQEGAIIGWNPAAERLFGHTEAEALGQALTLVIPERYRDEHLIGLQRVRAGGERHVIGRRVELHGLTKAGAEIPVELSLSTWETSKGAVFAGIVRDISDRRRAERALARQKDLYDMLSQTNQTIVRGPSAEDLFRAVCRIAVDRGRFRFAWIGVLEADGRSLKAIAWHGDEIDYVRDVRYSADESVPGGRGIVGHVLRTGRRDYTNDLLGEARRAPRHEAAHRAGVRALASLPLRRGGEVIGVITLYSNEPGFFTEDLFATLDEMAIDVSFALDNIERENAREKADEALRESEQRFRSLTELSSDWYWEMDRELRLSFHSGGFAQSSGTTSDKLLGKRRWEEPNRFPLSGAWDEHRATLEAHEPFRNFEYVRITDDGGQVFASISGVPVFNAAGEFNGYRGVGTNITGRKRAEQALTRRKDLYDMLSQTNQTIVRGPSTEDLFRAVCRIAVDHGRFRFAWIGVLEADGRSLQAIAWHGDDAGYVNEVRISADEAAPGGRGIIGQVLRTGRREYTNDMFAAGRDAAWHGAARRAGVCALASLPLRRGGEVIGVITVYSGEPGFFTEDLLATLDEMALDVSFALDNIEREAERKRTLDVLCAAEEQFRAVVEQSIAGIYIIQDGKFAYVNPRYAEIRGYDSPDELVGRGYLSVIAEKDRSMVAENVRRMFAGETGSRSYGITALCKDGSTVEIGVHGARATYQGRPAIIGMVQDISEKKRAEEQIRRYLSQLEKAFMSTVGVATTLSEMRDPYTAGHERRVAEIAVAIAAELGFDPGRLEGVRVAGCLHDLGKITIPTEILAKPGKLSAIEFKLIQGHPQASYDILKDVEFPWPVAEVALQHHERIDGSGYPQGLKGEAILLEARIMSVADVVEAMSSHRPYRPGLGIDNALAEIERGRGGAYDPEVADACLRLFREQGYAIPQ